MPPPIARDRRRLLELSVVALFLGVVFLPRILLGTSSYVLIHDNLDSELVYLHNLVQSGTMFSLDGEAVVPQVMNGLPRTAFRSGYNVVPALFALFDPFVAYTLTAVLVHAVAVVGTLVLLRSHVLPEPRHRALTLAIALAFGLIPFYVIYGVSVAGQPLLLHAILNIRAARSSFRDWLIVGGFPFFSVLYLVGIFIVAVLGLAWLVDVARTRKACLPLAAAIGVLALGYVVSEAPMLAAAFSDAGWVTHRVDFRRELFPRSFGQDARELLWAGNYHAGALFTGPTLAAAALALVLGERDARRGPVVGVGVAILAIFGIYATYPSIAAGPVGEVLPVLRYVQFDRFYFLLPLCWTLVLALSLATLVERQRLTGAVVLLLLAHAAFVARGNGELRNNVRLLVGAGSPEPTYAQFFAPDLFARIAQAIGLPQASYRVVTVGMHPSILQFNGFYTLDGYQNNYPLEHKRRFRAIIAPELARDAALRVYFDAWGNRCYVFSAELGMEFMAGRDGGHAIEELRIDVTALRELGGAYVLSAVPIGNAERIGLVPRGTFETPTSYWRVHLYQATPSGSEAHALGAP